MAGHVGGAPVLEHDLVLPEQFWANIKMPAEADMKTACWEWQGVVWKSGYGRWNQHNWGYWVHRVTYSQYRGVIPDGLSIDHLCMNKLCCNPFHLDPVTHKENIQRWAEQTIQSCPKGHPYTPENLVKGSVRRCKACHRAYERNRRATQQKAGIQKRPGAQGRPINTNTKLGWMIHQSGLRVYEVQGLAGVSNTMLSDYIACRVIPKPHHIVALCRLFDCEPEEILGYRTSPIPSGSGTADSGTHGPAGRSDPHVRPSEEGFGTSGSDTQGGLRAADAHDLSDPQRPQHGQPQGSPSDREHPRRPLGEEDHRSRN